MRTNPTRRNVVAAAFAAPFITRRAAAIPLYGGDAIPVPAGVRYVFWTFDGRSPTLNLPSLFTSSDGINFSQFYGSYLKPGPSNTLGQRDICLFPYAGFWWLSYTTCGFNNGTSFDIARGLSPMGPFNYWTTVDCSSVLSGATSPRVWGPTPFIDPATGNLYLLPAISKTGGLDTGFGTYYLTPNDNTLSSWSVPSLVGGVAALVANTINAWIRLNGSTYEFWVKDETAKTNVVLTSPTGPVSGYNALLRTMTAWGINQYEGVYVVPLGGANVRGYADAYTAGTGFAYADSTDNGATFGAPASISATPSFPVTRTGGMYDLQTGAPVNFAY